MNQISYQRFLTTRICDLKLDVNESMAPFFKRLKKELREKRIILWPDFYFGNEWGCVNKKISISVPFYLATPELKALEGDETTNEKMMKILRHETGHAINYAYKLWQRKGWEETFGDFNKKYRDGYLYRSSCKSYNRSRPRLSSHLPETRVSSNSKSLQTRGLQAFFLLHQDQRKCTNVKPFLLQQRAAIDSFVSRGQLCY